MVDIGDLIKIKSINKEGFYFLTLHGDKVAVVLLETLDTGWNKYLVVDSSDIKPIKKKAVKNVK